MRRRVEELAGQLRVVTPILLRAARKNTPVESYVDVLDNVLDDDGRTILVEFLRRDDWMQSLFGDNPDVARHAAWFESLRAVILDPSLLDEDTQGEDPGGAQAPQQGQAGMV